MRFFYYKGTPPLGEDPAIADNGAVFNITPAYTEVFIPYSLLTTPSPDKNLGDTYFVCYWYHTGGTNWQIATCWEGRFNDVSDMMADNSRGRAMGRAIRESWPLFTTLYLRAIDDNPESYDSTLELIQDPDTNARTWLLVVFFGNVHIEIGGDFFEGASLNALMRLYKLTGEVATETMFGDIGMLPNLDRYLEVEVTRKRLQKIGKAAPGILDTIAKLHNITS